MDARTLDRVIGHQLALLFEFGFLVALTVVDGHQFRRQIRHGEEVLVLHVGRQELNALLRQLHLVLLLVDDEVELGIGFGHLAFVVCEVDRLSLEQLLLHALKAQKLDKRFGLGQGAVCTEQGESAFGNVIFGGPVLLEEALGVRQELLGCLLLDRDELHHFGFEFDKFLLVALGGGAADDQRGSRFVDEHGVDLVDDGEVVLALDQLLWALGHVVAQVVEAEFVVGAVRDVGAVRLPAGFAVRLVLVDAIDPHAVEFEQRRHPFRVTAGEVIVHRYEVDALSGQRVEEHGERGDKRLALTRLHLRHLASVQGRTTDQLNIVVHHVPLYFRTGSHPGIAPRGLVAVDGDAAALSCDVPVPIRGGDSELPIFRQSPRSFFDECKRLRHEGLQHRFQRFVDTLGQSIDLLINGLLLFELVLSHGGGISTQRLFLFLEVRNMGLDALAQVLASRSQAIVR